MKHFLAKVQDTPCIIAADWNASPTGPAMDAQGLAVACMIEEEHLELLMPTEPTWKHKTYDFLLVNPTFVNKASPEANPFSHPNICEDLHQLLPTDHKLVCASRPSTWAQGLWKGVFAGVLCVQAIGQSDGAGDGGSGVFVLRGSSQRRKERAQWIADLHNEARTGDASAIAFLHNNRKSRPDWGSLVSARGGRETAVAAVHQHFHNVFAKTALPTRDDACEPYLATMRESMSHMQPTPITPDEHLASINKLKPGKTSGPTGMSNEFLKALSASNKGLDHLLTVLNTSFVPAPYLQPSTLALRASFPSASTYRSQNKSDPSSC